METALIVIFSIIGGTIVGALIFLGLIWLFHKPRY